uniref:Uncharacterized protein n=1 Tax=Chlamydomonas chlamydogama TaxID=225041 RepID=A0A6T5TRE9_9CHLO|mmetsp:Transcript_1294/g.2812  ORF Transcript_1294/g.2812 Transcript_1294/m.2812 type:complete len:414 (+) Transcript_1294:135-1376(+)|eukprot:CAMPEP_0202890068 /NCGR_PEP_ID=MMETSP1392-20130828/584_1 /ASSEMBLY_ACC=CAM_ASM_000868 /TAXON_ID=225041 /ORGANISM="Chlamydomonas chlamydogama, Strain SAG 11-48b" /LENGTH=413 /DNA_ID=CAMNT_0049573553 /DNA_START=178 /DNA_END=1419 /DNA_ORIENTATION=-
MAVVYFKHGQEDPVAVFCASGRFDLSCFKLKSSSIVLNKVAGCVEHETCITHPGAVEQLQLVEQGCGTQEKPIIVTGEPALPTPQGIPVTITLKKGKTSHEVTFNGTPTWSALESKVEELYRELRAEQFRLKAGKRELSEKNWHAYAKAKPFMTLGVISECKPFSAFKADEAFDVLGTAHQYADEPEDPDVVFPLAPYNPSAEAKKVLQESLNLHTHADIVAHAGKEVALRCCMTNPEKYTKEASKREVISPVIFAAAAMAGDVRVEAEYDVNGTLGRGAVDYVIVYRNFSIVVVEGKLHDTLEKHLGQLAAEIRSAREQYKRVYLGKRKREDEGDFKKVPSFGILTNGTRYIFYKYTPEDRLLVQHAVQAHLKHCIKADEATSQVLPIIRHLVHIIQQQMQCMQSFQRAQTG